MQSKITNALARREYVKVKVNGDPNMYVTTIDEVDRFVNHHGKVLHVANVFLGEIREIASLRNIVIDHYYDGLEYYFNLDDAAVMKAIDDALL